MRSDIFPGPVCEREIGMPLNSSMLSRRQAPCAVLYTAATRAGGVRHCYFLTSDFNVFCLSNSASRILDL